MEKITTLITKFNTWINKHQKFALSLPIGILLLLFFITNSLSSMRDVSSSDTKKKGYNNFLPNQENELEVKDPQSLFKKTQMDSLKMLRKDNVLKNIVGAPQEVDSLQELLQELDNFSMDLEDETNVTLLEDTKNGTSEMSPYEAKKSEVSEKLAYRQMLMRGREERLSQSQDYSAPGTFTDTVAINKGLHWNVSIYKDQFILPGSRVTLLLNESVHWRGHTFPKNTFVYANSNLQGNRVVPEVSHIASVPVSLMAIDPLDGIEGLHNERAGELLQEFKTDLEKQGIDEVSRLTGANINSPLASRLISSFGQFFQKRKYREQDKILLVHGDQLYLVNKD
ncbi:conjugative transposon protein TraM [Maribacter litopenaei]|uniref:Conjugative transposon protein TraM n=1 Tax=Maribacter litopenaei TaxID=2976127 RepID=A0ABY5Y5L6_9FLAO|nr:conjugative transposon protein TraM [Maribacter litopenaei]UWX54326.1 conjugative transposon protein TraM [Maribacter litopenaei]